MERACHDSSLSTDHSPIETLIRLMTQFKCFCDQRGYPLQRTKLDHKFLELKRKKQALIVRRSQLVGLNKTANKQNLLSRYRSMAFASDKTPGIEGGNVLAIRLWVRGSDSGASRLLVWSPSGDTISLNFCVALKLQK